MQVKKTTQETVYPAAPSPGGVLQLSNNDQIMPRLYTSLLLFFNEEPLQKASVLLRASLAEALTLFYPCAGRYTEKRNGGLEIVCNDKGAMFSEIWVDRKLDGFLPNFDPHPDFALLVPELDASAEISQIPLLFAQEEFIILPVDEFTKSFTWEGWGTSLCWWANFAGGLSSEDREPILDLLFDLKKGLGLNIVRYNIGGGADPELDEYLRPFGHVPGLKPSPDRPYDWSADARQQSILFGARDRGANVFEAFSNSPPYWMTLSGSVTGNVRWGQDNLNPDYDEAFVDYLTEVVKHYRDHWGLHFDYIAPFNEPLEGWWNIDRKKTTAQEGCNFSASSMNRVIPKLKKGLDEKKLQTKVSAFDAWSQNTVRALLTMDEAALSAIDQINVHTYVFITSREEFAKRKQVREAAASVGKKMWMSEYGPLNWRAQDIDVALGVGRHIALDLNELQASAWCYWQALEMPGSSWGLIQTHFGYDVQPRDLFISKQYYVFMQFTKWIRPGFQVFPVAAFADRFLVAANFLEKTAVLVFINESTAYRDYSYDMSLIAPWLSTHCKTEALLFRTSPTEDHVQLPTMLYNFPTVMVRVDSKSVTTMVLSEAK